MLLNSSLQSRRVSPNHLLDLLAVLEENEGRHGADSQFLGHFWVLVDVKLDKVDVGVLLAPAGDLGRDGLAGTAPFGEGVDDDQLVAGERALEFGFAVWRKTGLVWCISMYAIYIFAGDFYETGWTYLARVLTTIVTGVDRKRFRGVEVKVRDGTERVEVATSRRRDDEARVSGELIGLFDVSRIN